MGEMGPTIAAVFDVPATTDIGKWECTLRHAVGDTPHDRPIEDSEILHYGVVKEVEGAPQEADQPIKTKRLFAKFSSIVACEKWTKPNPGQGHFFIIDAKYDESFCFAAIYPKFKLIPWSEKRITDNWLGQGKSPFFSLFFSRFIGYQIV